MARQAKDHDSAEARWTVRGVPEAYRARANARADSMDASVGEWLCHAIDIADAEGRRPVEIAPPKPESGPMSAAEILELAIRLREATGGLRQDVSKILNDGIAGLASHTFGVEWKPRNRAPRLQSGVTSEHSAGMIEGKPMP